MFDGHNQYTGKMYGQDRIGHTTPDLEASDPYRPWLPCAYPAPYLPGLRQDQGHPKLGTKVLSSQMLVGLDKSGALVPAGLFSGSQPNGAMLVPTALSIDTNVLTVTVANKMAEGETFKISGGAGATAYLNGTYVAKTGTDATKIVCDLTHADGDPSTTGIKVQSQSGGKYCVLHFKSGIDEFAISPVDGKAVAAGTKVLLAAPADATTDEVITLDDGSTYSPSADDITFALACDLFPTGVARPIGVATRDVYQYIGGVKVKSTTGGVLYQLEGVVPTGFQVHNYMHEMGTAIQTEYVVRVPWVGATRKTLTAKAATATVTGYAQGYGLSFTHATGDFKVGSMVAASRENFDAGNYGVYDATKHSLADVVGRVLGVINMIDKIGYASRIKSLWDPARMVGPVKDPNPASIMMGGSATGGLPYDINLTTDGLYKACKSQKKTAVAEMGTYILIRVLL